MGKHWQYKDSILSVGVIWYNPQQSRANSSELKKIHKNIKQQINESSIRNNKVLVSGNFVCKVGDMISNNTSQISIGGMFKNLIEKTNCCLTNGTEKCQGLWAWTIKN